MADTLEPIVIPPLKVDKHFTCSGSGLRYEDEERVSAESLRTLLLPSGGRNGIADRDRSKAWWGAQALFYGFKYTKTMTISQVRAQLEDALRDKNKGLRVPQSIMDLEYKYNKEFRELNAEVRNKAGMGTKRKQEADPVLPKATKSKSADGPSVKTTAKPFPDAVPRKKPRIRQTDYVSVPAELPKPRIRQTDYVSVPAELPKPRTKQTAKKATGVQQMDWMEVDMNPQPSDAPKPRTKQTARKTTQPGGAQSIDIDVKPRTKQTAKKTTQSTGDQPIDVDVKPRTKQTGRKTVKLEDDFDDLVEPHAPGTKTTARWTEPVPADAVASSSSVPAPAGRPKQTARRGKPFPAPPARSSAPRTDSVSGYWAIDCPAISGEWDYTDFSLIVIGRGTSLEGEFELGIISGLLRSDRVEQRGPNGAYAAVVWARQDNQGLV
ncbi:hypothetical protein B0H19DRAFT_1265790 [Mycena capillaripes]|nr:hypothetical protein B0H19DRAFT_1265790 [Mycena capillaripes]